MDFARVKNPAKGSSGFDNKPLEDYADFLRGKYPLNRKVLLVQVLQMQFESFDETIARNRSYYAFPPTGLQCIAKALERRNLDVHILDLNYELLKRVCSNGSFDIRDWPSILDDYLERYQPAVIGTTCINVSNLFTKTNPFTNFLEHVKKKGRHIVLSGGASIMNGFEECLKKELVHFVIDGEGENRINFLFDVLYKENNGYDPASKIYFKPLDQVVQTQGADSAVCLKGNLIDTYKQIRIEDYCNVGVLNHYSKMAGDRKPFTAIQLVRGCRMNCKFCGVPKFMGDNVSCYPVQDLLEEITYLVEQRGIRHFEWLDDDLLADPEAFKSVLRGMIELKKKYGISWSTNQGFIAAFLTEELLTLIRDSGCIAFKIGVESGNPEMLARIRKPATINKLLSAGKLINKFPEIFVGGHYIIGFFGEETFKQMLQTFSFACKMNLDWSSMSVFQFTSAKTAKEEKLKTKDMGDFAVIPARYRTDGKVLTGEDVLTGPEIFSLPKDLVPSPDQVRQIWFAFNLVGNYINNKNLKPGGRPENFVSWVEVLELTYPFNAYMPLFSALARCMLGQATMANEQLERAKFNLSREPYWRQKFKEFGLDEIVRRFPKNPDEVQEVLEPLRERYAEYIGEPPRLTGEFCAPCNEAGRKPGGI